MPHLHISKFNELNFPSSMGDVKFNFIANNVNSKEEKLIATNLDGNDFFLLVKDEENKTLLKTDKLTRPASTHNAHKALLAYANLAKLDIISSNVLQNPKNVHLQETNALKNIEYFASNFMTDKEIRVEVGFGSGRHLLHQALNNPDILFIGIEIHRPSIEQVLKQISIKKIDNILLLDYDARLFMELIPSNSVGKIYVHFPVPWDKKPHRRVISPLFVNEARRVLKLGGALELRTDSENYYAYSYETFMAQNRVVLNISKNIDIAISSKYEDRWKKMEKNIYDLTMINEELSAELSYEDDFVFKDVNLPYDEIIKLHKVMKRFDDGFINIERVYTLEDGVMLRTAMGSFDRPEHLYVLINNNSASYFPSNPLKSKSNLQAHKLLNRILHG